MRQYLYGDDAGGIPPGLFGEAYIAAGILGVIFYIYSLWQDAACYIYFVPKSNYD